MDSYTTALLEMEMWLTQSMQDMIAPLKISINSLVVSQQDWEQQKSDVQLLHAEKDCLNIKIQEVEAKNTKLESRVKKLENCLMENNLIMHGVREGKWELDSTRNELVIQAISNTVEADTPSNKLEIARKIPITSTSRIRKYNPSRSQPIKIAFASKSDADLLMEHKKKLQQGVYVDREYSEDEECDRKILRPILRAAHKLPHYRGK